MFNPVVKAPEACPQCGKCKEGTGSAPPDKEVDDHPPAQERVVKPQTLEEREEQAQEIKPIKIVPVHGRITRPVHEQIHERPEIKIVEKPDIIPEKRDIIKVKTCTDFSGTYTSQKNGKTYRISQEVHPGVCKATVTNVMRKRMVGKGTVSNRMISMWGQTGTLMMSAKRDPSGKVVIKKEGIQWSKGSVWKRLITATTKQTTTTTSTTSTTATSTSSTTKKQRKPRSTRRRRWSGSTRRRRGSASARRRRRRRRRSAATTATTTKKSGFSIDYRRRRTFSTNKDRRRRKR